MRTFTAIIWLVVFCCQSRAQTFTAEGIIRYEVLNHSAQIIYSLEKTFEISRNDCRWWIQTRPVPGSDGDGGVLYDEVACNGNDVFSLRVFDPEKIEEPPRKTDGSGKPMNNYVDNAKVLSGVVPSADSTFAHPVWLAFASRCFLDNTRDNKVKPVQILHDDLLFSDLTYTQTAKWKLNSEGFLDEMVYFSDGTSTSPIHGVKTITKFPPPFDQGFTNSLYQTLRSTNINNFAVPAEFVLLNYRPQSQGKSSNDVAVGSRFTGKIHRLTRESRSDFYPALARPQLVEDFRFVDRGAGRFRYQQPDGWYKSMEDPKLLYMLKFHLAANPASAQMQRAREAAIASTTIAEPPTPSTDAFPVAHIETENHPVKTNFNTYIAAALAALLMIAGFSVFRRRKS